MIHIFPHSECSIDTAKSPEDINMILKSVTASKVKMFYNSCDVKFIGEVNPVDFKIVRRGYGGKDSRPVIMGNIRTKSGKSVIDIKMCLDLPMQIFLSFLFGWLCLLFFAGLFSVFPKGVNEGIMLFASIAFLLFGQVLIRIEFYLKAKRDIRRLEELLK